VRQQGVSFQQTMTLGRQFLLMSPRQVKRLAQEYQVSLSSSWTDHQFADLFFRDFLGSDVVCSVDATNYEGATMVHDMNGPFPEAVDCTQDVVIDGGTLEHLFHVPMALANCLRAVKVGGYFFSFTVANNFFGHGFYQFSPELFFRVLNEQYGFHIEQVVAIEYDSPNIALSQNSRWYLITDPDIIRSRVTLVNRRPILLALYARKVAHHHTLFPPYPQQSDYLQAWQAPRTTALKTMRRHVQNALSRLPVVGHGLVHAYTAYKAVAVHTLNNRAFFTKLPQKQLPLRTEDRG
jgi:SAM-dependent methyltransferase